jgi:hypothetical protein
VGTGGDVGCPPIDGVTIVTYITAMAKSVRQTITFTEAQFAWLKAEAARLGITVADLLRRLIDEGRDRRR